MVSECGAQERNRVVRSRSIIHHAPHAPAHALLTLTTVCLFRLRTCFPMATIIPLTDARSASNPAARRAELDAFVRHAARGPAVAPGPLADPRGRPLSDLRISVTDRCNFRCVYCMPRDVFDADYHFLPHAELLTFEEIARIAKLFVARGV